MDPDAGTIFSENCNEGNEKPQDEEPTKKGLEKVKESLPMSEAGPEKGRGPPTQSPKVSGDKPTENPGSRSSNNEETHNTEHNDGKICSSQSPRRPSIQIECPILNFPSPLKKAVHWPSASKKTALQTLPKDVPPSAVTGDTWNDFHRLKLNKKIEEREIIEKKKAERLIKRDLKAQEMQIRKNARAIKKEKDLELKKQKDAAKAAKGKKKSPNVVAKKGGMKRKLQKTIKAQKPSLARQMKEEVLNDSGESGDHEATSSPPAKVPLIGLSIGG